MSGHTVFDESGEPSGEELVVFISDISSGVDVQPGTQRFPFLATAVMVPVQTFDDVDEITFAFRF